MLADRGRALVIRGVAGLVRRATGRELEDVIAGRCQIINRVEGARDFALTFDDGPFPRTTPVVLAALRETGAKATFFCTGDNARNYPALLREIAAEGHEIGSHSMTHRDFNFALPGQVRSEMTQSKTLIEDILGARIRAFRAPYGHFHFGLADGPRVGIDRLVKWDVAPPCDTPDEAVVSEALRAQVRPGSIVLLHDHLIGADPQLAFEAVSATARSLSVVLPELRARGMASRSVAGLINSLN